jgi:hypothetical protein
MPSAGLKYRTTAFVEVDKTVLLKFPANCDEPPAERQTALDRVAGPGPPGPLSIVWVTSPVRSGYMLS